MSDTSGIAAEKLRSFVERIVRLEEYKRDIANDIKEVMSEARSMGFAPKVLRQIVRERMMDPDDLEEFQALCDIYRGALGMLNGTPLGQAAVRRLTKRPEPTPPPDQTDIENFTRDPDAKSEAELASVPLVSKLDIENARAAGRKAAIAGKSVTDNEFPPHDPRRAAWDEGWCQAAGSDGMEIPEAFRRKPKKTDDQAAVEPSSEEPPSEAAPATKKLETKAEPETKTKATPKSKGNSKADDDDKRPAA